MKALFIVLALFGVIALCWHVGALQATAFSVVGATVSWGFLLLVGVFFLGILKLKAK